MPISAPSDLTGLVAWYDASQLTGLVDGAQVATFTDYGGSSRHLAQSTATKRPTYRTAVTPTGKPVVRFDGVDDLMFVNFGVTVNVGTVLFVASMGGQVGAVLLDRGSFASERVVVGAVNLNTTDAVFMGNDLSTAAPAWTGNRPYSMAVFAGVIDGASSQARRNGVLEDTGQANASTARGLTLGGRYSNDRFMAADVGEVIYYDRTLTSTEIADVEAYLRDKWLGAPVVPITVAGEAAIVSVSAGDGTPITPVLVTGEAATVSVSALDGTPIVPTAEPVIVTGEAATVTLTALDGNVTGVTVDGEPAGVIVGAGEGGITGAPIVIAGERATVTVAALQGTVVVTFGTARRTLDTSRRRRTGQGFVDITVPVAPEPPTITRAPIRVVVDTLPAPQVSAAGHVQPLTPTVLRDTEWGRVRLAVSHTDVTYLRDKPAQVVDWQLLDPYGYGPATLRFPQVTFWELPDFGTGGLSWLRKNAPVRIHHVQAGEQRRLLWMGHIDAFDFDDDGALLCDCSGELSGRMDKTHRTQRLVRSVHDAGFMARIALSIQNRSYRLKGSAEDWGRTGIEMENLGGGMGTNLAFLDHVLANAVTQDLDSWTILPTDAEPDTFDLVKRDRTTVHATVYLGARGVSARLRDDQLEQPTRMFGEGVAPDGRRWRGAEYPNLGPEVVPPYPYTDGRTFGRIGLVDADTDTGDGIRVLEDELLGSGLLRLEERNGEWTRSTTEAVEEVQRRAGLAVTGKVNPATWTAIWGDGDAQQRLTQARIHPLTWRTETEKWLYSPNGSIIGRNPDHDRRVPRIERAVSFGEGVTKAKARRWLRREMNRAGGTNWRGTITLTSDVMAGDHTFGTPGTPLSRMDLKAGQNIKVVRWGSAQGTLMHIASCQVSGLDGDSPQVELAVDTQFRDAITLAEMLERDKAARRDPAREWLNQHRRSTMPSDSLVGWDYEAGAGVVRRTRLVGNKWNVVKVVGGQAGEIQRVDLTTANNPAAFVCAVFARPVRPGELAQRVGDPFITVGTEEVWQQVPVADWLAGLDPEDRKAARDSAHQREGFTKAEDGTWVPPDYHQGNIVRDSDGKWTSVTSPPSGQELADLQAAEANRREERVTAALQTFADARVGVYVAGTSSQPCGYWPRSKTNSQGNPSGHPVTGRWRDDASFSYWTIGPRSPWLYLAVYPDRDCTIFGRMYDQLIEGA